MHKFSKSALWLVGIYVLCITITSSSQAAEHTSNEWKKVKEHDGITVSTRMGVTPQGVEYMRIRGVGRVVVNDLYSIVAITEDLESYPAWLSLVSSATEISQDDYFTRYMQYIVRFPIINDRDLVVKGVVSQDPNTETITMVLTNEYDFIPLDPAYIRFVEFDGLFVSEVISSTEVNLTYEVQVNMGGLMPTNIANYLSAFAPYLTIKNLRELVKNPKYKNRQTEQSTFKFRTPLNE